MNREQHILKELRVWLEEAIMYDHGYIWVPDVLYKLDKLEQEHE